MSIGRPVRYLLLLAWMGLITFWSSQSELPIDQPVVAGFLRGLQHTLAHIVGFGTLALLARWAFAGSPRAWWGAVLLTSAFGALDELHQVFTPGRRAGPDDWLVDTLAAAAAVLLWAVVAGQSRRGQGTGALVPRDGSHWPPGLLRRMGLRRRIGLRGSRARMAIALGTGAVIGLVGTGVLFAATPLTAPRPAIRQVPATVTRGAVALARSARDLARQVRADLHDLRTS